MVKENKKIMIHAYKRNGWLYRVWEFPKVIESNEQYVCASLYNARVITNEKNSKRNFHSKNLKNSFWFFFYERWFNIIATLNPNNTVTYYINIASPFLYEEEAIKYYDFDLDIKIKSSKPNDFKVVDVDEYNEHKKIFHYEKEIQNECEKTLSYFYNKNFREKVLRVISSELLQSFIKKEQE